MLRERRDCPARLETTFRIRLKHVQSVTPTDIQVAAWVHVHADVEGFGIRVDDVQPKLLIHAVIAVLARDGAAGRQNTILLIRFLRIISARPVRCFRHSLLLQKAAKGRLVARSGNT